MYSHLRQVVTFPKICRSSMVSLSSMALLCVVHCMAHVGICAVMKPCDEKALQKKQLVSTFIRAIHTLMTRHCQKCQLSKIILHCRKNHVENSGIEN